MMLFQPRQNAPFLSVKALCETGCKQDALIEKNSLNAGPHCWDLNAALHYHVCGAMLKNSA